MTTDELSTRVAPAGADWLASASAFPRSVRALWAARPTAPSVLPCGTAFDVVSTAAVFGRRVLEELWSTGPGSGPVALHRGRLLLFAGPGTAQRLTALLEWEEWAGRRHPVPPLLCLGAGDAVTVPPVRSVPAEHAPSRWLVAPDTARPYLPGPEVLLWACVRAARSGHGERRTSRGRRADHRISIFSGRDADAKVYDVSRRR